MDFRITLYSLSTNNPQPARGNPECGRTVADRCHLSAIAIDPAMQLQSDVFNRRG
jgi:hypothetical protein